LKEVLVKNMFSVSPFWNASRGGIQGLGFTPGPVQVRVVGQPAAFQPQAPAPQLLPPMPPVPQQPYQNAPVPFGDKASCPVCRNFGG
jgi:hypothetical protein